MVKVSYRAQEQVKRLSPRERLELASALDGAEPTAKATKVEDSEKFVTRFGKNKRAVWEKESDGNILVLAVVSK
jgi:hypothetical protein